jgi:Tol biopolymer transport system component
MKITFTLALLILIVLALCGCSINVAAPLPSTPASEPASASQTPSPASGPEDLTIPSPKTTVPITWANLNLAGKLVYISVDTLDHTAAPAIQVLALASGGVSTIFQAPQGGWIYYLAVSPDGKQIVMSYVPPSPPASPSNRALYILPLDGTEPPRILITPPTPADQYTQVEWSPDGRYIYYVHYDQDHPDDPLQSPFYLPYEIFRMAYPDGQPEKILDNASWLRISSDSSQLVYVSSDPASDRNSLFLANTDGSNSRKVALSGSCVPEIIDAPIFSPDGQSILLSAPPPPQVYQPNWFEKLMGIRVASAHDVPSDWWSVPVTGGELTRLTQLQTINLFASISPDKQHIASVSGEGIFVMDGDGSNLTQLLFDPGVLGTVNWIP